MPAERRVARPFSRPVPPAARCHHEPMFSPGPTIRHALVAAVVATTAFALFTVWWLVDGGMQLDATMLRFTGWLLRGWLDVVISASWPLGEPQFGLATVGLIATLLVVRRRYRAAALVVGGFVVLSAVEVAMLVTLAEIRHTSLGVDALVRLYPSGHTARVPYLGTGLAAIAGRQARGWILTVTAVLAMAIALDRTDSTIQTGSAVIGGLLMGISVSLWFVALFSAWARTSR
jgi:hypothetical protein